MMDVDRSIRQNIAWLRDCSALIRGTPALWPSWWPVARACEFEAARLEQTVADYRPETPAGTIGAEVIDLAEWRRRKAAAPAWRPQGAGGAA